MSDKITEEQIKKLAQNMVVAVSLNNLYGIEQFLKAKLLFETALHEFAEQLVTISPALVPEAPVVAVPRSIGISIKDDKELVPECLRRY